MKTIKEICRKDNNLQKQIIHKQITTEEFNAKIKTLHKEYSDATNERNLLNKLVLKYKPIKEVKDLKEYL